MLSSMILRTNLALSIAAFSHPAFLLSSHPGKSNARNTQLVPASGGATRLVHITTSLPGLVSLNRRISGPILCLGNAETFLTNNQFVPTRLISLCRSCGKLELIAVDYFSRLVRSGLPNVFLTYLNDPKPSAPWLGVSAFGMSIAHRPSSYGRTTIRTNGLAVRLEFIFHKPRTVRPQFSPWA